ncbi:MAG: hypothetical protein RQ751_09155 [Longimicrobiales bacterium]|nr:hypothetical protein [Longimicrobiales bacterium]
MTSLTLRYDHLDERITAWMAHSGIPLLRFSMGPAAPSASGWRASTSSGIWSC